MMSWFTFWRALTNKSTDANPAPAARTPDRVVQWAVEHRLRRCEKRLRSRLQKEKEEHQLQMALLKKDLEDALEANKILEGRLQEVECQLEIQILRLELETFRLEDIADNPSILCNVHLMETILEDFSED